MDKPGSMRVSHRIRWSPTNRVMNSVVQLEKIGEQAYKNGRRLSDIPDTLFFLGADAWIRGWTKAKNESEQNTRK